MKILIVEDEEKLIAALRRGLSHYGYTIDSVENGREAMERIVLHHENYDLIILDLMLPDLDGLAICREVRAREITTPILVLTARMETATKVELLKAGADDYVSKPFSLSELEARIQALLRRPQEKVLSSLTVGPLTIHLDEHRVTKDGADLHLTQKEYALLEYFMRNPDRVISRDELLNHIWDFNYTSFFSNAVDVHIKNLRKKIEYASGPRLLETVRGVGYRLRSEHGA